MAVSLEGGGEWLLLSTAVARMSELHPGYRSFPGYARGDLECAIQASRVLIRGCSPGALNHPPELIAEPITNSHRLNLIHNTLSERGRGSMGYNTLFRDVEVEWTGAERYLHKFALARWPLPSEQRPTPKTRMRGTAPKKVPVRRRGPRPIKLEEVKGRMRDEIKSGQCTKDELQCMLQKTLASKYDVSRDTACKARDAVLSEFADNSISTK